jgi:hypothetical protein
MKREKRLTKREMKALQRRNGPPVTPTTADGHGDHIHCIACGKHLVPDLFGEPGGASYTRCNHGTDFAHCNSCADEAQRRIAEHDTSGRPIATAAAWH